MSRKPVYTDAHFTFLMASAMAYGAVYTTSDAQVYRDEESAINRCRDFMKLRQIVKYATITPTNCPTNEEELEKLMVTVESEMAKPAEPATKPVVLDLEAAAKALKNRKEPKSTGKTKQ